MMAVRVARALGLEAMAFMVVFPVITALERGKKRWSAATEFGTKTYGSSIIFVLVTCVMYILVVMATLAHVLFGVVCVLLAPAVYSFMAVLRCAIVGLYPMCRPHHLVASISWQSANESGHLLIVNAPRPTPRATLLILF